jgi:hypothetical protein
MRMPSWIKPEIQLGSVLNAGMSLIILIGGGIVAWAVWTTKTEHVSALTASDVAQLRIAHNQMAAVDAAQNVSIHAMKTDIAVITKDIGYIRETLGRLERTMVRP